MSALGSISFLSATSPHAMLADEQLFGGEQGYLFRPRRRQTDYGDAPCREQLQRSKEAASKHTIVRTAGQEDAQKECHVW